MKSNLAVTCEVRTFYDIEPADGGLSVTVNTDGIKLEVFLTAEEVDEFIGLAKLAMDTAQATTNLERGRSLVSSAHNPRPNA